MMTERCLGSVSCGPEDLREALCIHTRKITDSCRDKDCIEDLRVYLTQSSQSILDTATGAKVRCADLIYTYIDVEPVAFDRNHYCIDVTFFYRILADAIVEGSRPVTLQGLAIFGKRAVLCGEDSKTHVFTSQEGTVDTEGLSSFAGNRPTGVVEVLDPMVLSSKIRQVGECVCRETTVPQIPEAVRQLFDEALVVSGETRRLFVTLGQFSIIRLERDAQLLIPVLDYCIPTKECCDHPGCAEDPCEVFSKIPFPEQQFAPRSCGGESGQGCNCYTTTEH